jgi:alpha-D-ribose 1-methylphosphonate 5-triphosphate synthase subunit PhnH
MTKPTLDAPNPLAAWQAEAQQQAFRQILTAVSYPGRCVELNPQNGPALVQVLATLVDNASTLALPAQPQALGLPETDRLRLAAPSAAPEHARFVLADGAQPPGFEPALGTLESPEGGATLVLMVAALGEGPAVRLSGPGVPPQETGSPGLAVRITGLHPQWWRQRQAWCSGFPMGVDVLLVSSQQLLALPRTTRVDTQGEAAWAT